MRKTWLTQFDSKKEKEIMKEQKMEAIVTEWAAPKIEWAGKEHRNEVWQRERERQKESTNYSYEEKH